MAAHPETLGTAVALGILLLATARKAIARTMGERDRLKASLVLMITGVAFAIARLIHLSVDDAGVALVVVRAQVALGLATPGLGMAAMEVRAGRAISRVTKIVIGVTAIVFGICVATPAIATHAVRHEDAFGHEFWGASAGWFMLIIPVANIAGVLAVRSRAKEITDALHTQRTAFLIAVLLFAVGAANDVLLGIGVIRSIFLLDYAFAVAAVLAISFDLGYEELERGGLEAELLAKKLNLEEREALLERAHRRIARSDERYRHLADATREGVVLCSGFRVLDLNQAACRLLGTPEKPIKPASLRSADLRTFVVESDRGRIEDMLGSDDGPFDMVFRRSDEALVPVSVRGVPAPPGSKGTRVLIVRDVTTERELQRRLATADRLAAVGALAAGTAHEINNPLAFVLSNADLVEEELDKLQGDTAEAREMIADIKHGALRIRDVVRDLMSLAREKGGQVTNVDLNETLRRCAAMAAPQTRHRAQVVTRLEELRAVRANEGRLFQVFLNLLVNAAQAIPEGAADKNRITITGKNVDDTVVIEITDTGSGIPRDVVDRIFEPFFTTKAIGQGTGLGLSISHGIVTDLGGRIEVDSTVGVGTTFRVILLADGVHEVTAPIRIAPVTSPRLRVLIVDDEHRFAQSLARMLDTHQVDVAYSGRAALEQIASHTYDVALCDVMMPDVTGIQLYQQLCARHDPIADRFLFMTGGVTFPEAQKFLEQLGATRWVPKPIPMADLRRMVTEVGARSPAS